MDFGKAFGFLFEDEEWVKKVLLGALISLIPIVGQFILFGYGIAVLRNVKAGDPRPLPDWGEFGEFLVDGLKFWVATLVYALPMILLACPVTLLSLAPLLSRGNEDMMAVLGGVAGIVGLGVACIAAAYGVLLALLSPVIQIRYAETGQIGACLRFGDVFGYLRRNFGSVAVAAFVSILTSGLVVGVLGAVSFGLLALPATVWVTSFSGHLYGQIARSDSALSDPLQTPVLEEDARE